MSIWEKVCRELYGPDFTLRGFSDDEDDAVSSDSETESESEEDEDTVILILSYLYHNSNKC